MWNYTDIKGSIKFVKIKSIFFSRSEENKMVIKTEHQPDAPVPTNIFDPFMEPNQYNNQQITSQARGFTPNVLF